MTNQTITPDTPTTTDSTTDAAADAATDSTPDAPDTTVGSPAKATAPVGSDATATARIETGAPFVATAAQPTVPLGDKAAFATASAPSTPGAAPAFTPVPTPTGGYSSAPGAPSGGVASGQGTGAPLPQYYPAVPQTNTLGIVTLVLGILGFGLVPVITGHIALGQIKRNREDGYGITLAGLILGYVTLAAWLLVALFWIGAAGIALFGAFAAAAA